MKIMINDDVNMIIFLNKKYLGKIDFNNREKLENYFQKLLKTLKDYYNINLQGYYDIDVYLDSIYGVVLELHKENIEYFGYFDDEIEMQLIFHNTHFLYEIEEPFWIDHHVKSHISIYRYQNKLYLKINDDLSYVLLGKIIEHSKIRYQLNYHLIEKEKNLVAISEK